MRMRSILAGLALASILAASHPAAAESWLLENVHVVDPATESISDRTRLAVLNGWIVTPDELPRDARRIDAGGRFVIPGLTEMHAHVPPS
ncbi:MAG: hypothetical protein ACPGJE_10235, partial [Wenzhouxiangellaceae bacterium]